MDATDVSVVVPCYNEENRIDVRSFEEFLSCERGPKLLFVDDGSRDRTRTLLEQLCRSNPARAGLLACEQNAGKAEAVRRGIVYLFAVGRPAVVGYWDADLATPLNSIHSLFEVLQANDSLEMVFGARIKLLGRHIHRRAARHYLGRVFATVVSNVLNLSIYDTQCGAKLFRVNDTCREVFAKPFLSKWVFDVEIIARYSEAWNHDRRRLEEAIYEYPLESWTDVAGSKLSPTDFIAAFGDVLRIWFEYRYQRRSK